MNQQHKAHRKTDAGIIEHFSGTEAECEAKVAEWSKDPATLTAFTSRVIRRVG